MSEWSRLRALWRNLVHRGRVDRDLEEELTSLGIAHPDLIAANVREARAGGAIDGIRQDVTFGLRLLRRQPLFTATAVLSLGLGIGASTTIFSLVNALLLRSVGVQEPAALVELGRTTPTGRGTAFSYPAYERFRDENTVLSGVLTMAKNTMT